MNACNSEGELFSLQATFERRKINRRKIRRINLTQADEGGFPFALAPFMKEWGCLDNERIAEAAKQMDSMGIERVAVVDGTPET